MATVTAQVPCLWFCSVGEMVLAGSEDAGESREVALPRLSELLLESHLYKS